MTVLSLPMIELLSSESLVPVEFKLVDGPLLPFIEYVLNVYQSKIQYWRSAGRVQDPRYRTVSVEILWAYFYTLFRSEKSKASPLSFNIVHQLRATRLKSFKCILLMKNLSLWRSNMLKVITNKTFYGFILCLKMILNIYTKLTF